jgi:TolB-like protein/Flp pilus assembly protein TadD
MWSLGETVKFSDGHVTAPACAYKFGSFSLIPGDKQLLHDGTPVPLAPKAFDTLMVLVRKHGHLVEKAELLKHVWPDSFVEEVAVAHCVSEVRKALRHLASDSEFIQTVPTRGYRFVAAVEAEEVATFEPAARTRLAVLPFETFGADVEREYLADGLTEEVIAALGQIDARLGVIGRTSMMVYKHTTKSLAAIGAELGAEYLVESSLRAEGTRLRITSKLIRARDQLQVWSGSYDGESQSVLEFQRALSGAIAREVQLRLSPDRMHLLDRRQPRDVQAYDLYLRGRHFWNQLSPPTTKRAVESYRRAIALDPGYALAWSGLAVAYTASPINGDAPPLEMWPHARDAANQAVHFAADLAESQTAWGLFNFWLEWDWRVAEEACRNAVALDPSDGSAHRTLGVVLSALMRHDEARAAADRSRALDPFDATSHALAAQLAFAARDNSAAVELARQCVALSPNFWVAHYQLAQAYEQLGRHEAALEALQQAAPFSHGNSKVISLRGYILARLGRTAESEQLLATLAAPSRERYVPPYATALVHAGLNHRDTAYEWLERAHGAHDVHLVLLVTDPKWDAFRTDPRFEGLLTKCGFQVRGFGTI